MTPQNTSTSLHRAEDYEYLRSEGLAYIQKLSGKLWSDYNIHDPGVTMLEILCFALADLGFRAGHPIQDMLAPAIDHPGTKQFFDIAELGFSKPWSVNDYRSFLIDLPGVANAWLSKSETQEVPIFLVGESTKTLLVSDNLRTHGTKITLNGLYDVAIRFEEDPQFGDLNDNSLRFWESIRQERAAPLNEVFFNAEVEVEFPFFNNLSRRLQKILIKGSDFIQIASMASISGEKYAWIFNLIVTDEAGLPLPDLNGEKFAVAVRILQGQEDLIQVNNALAHFSVSWWKNVLQSHFFPRRKRIEEKLANINASLMANRNLCEDVMQIVPMDLQEIALDLDLEISEGYDLVAIEVAIYESLRLHLDPPTHFYSLAEMLEKGFQIDEIFEGPKLENGFLDPREMEARQTRTNIYGSDILQLVMRIEGVHALRSIKIHNRIAGELVASGMDNIVLTEPGRFQPTIDVRRSKVRFFKGRQAAESADKVEVFQAYQAGLFASTVNKGVNSQTSPEIQQGRNRNLDAYYSVQEEFPLAWGIGSAGPPASADAERIGKAKQLKGYLFFFEQVMVNYLQQLNHVKQLFAIHPDEEIATYVSKLALEIPGIQLLVPELNPASGPSLIENTIFERLQTMSDEPRKAQDRLDRLHKHLLARFNESIADWIGDVWTAAGNAAKVSLDAQKQLLRNYAGIGYARAGALDYTSKNAQSGFKERIRALLGWDVAGATMLAKAGFHIVEHILLRPTTLDASLLLPRYDDSTPLFNVCDPWSLRLSIVLDRSVFRADTPGNVKFKVQNLIREALPAHLYVEFYWLEEAEFAYFTTKFATWLTNTKKSTFKRDLVNSINALKNKGGAKCVVQQNLRKTDVKINDVLATVYDEDGAIIKAWQSNYREFPVETPFSNNELILDGATGEVKYSGEKRLDGITDFPLEYYTMNASGGINFHSEKLSLIKDELPFYTVNQFDFEIKASMKVATVTDKDNAIVIAELKKGKLPEGLELNEVSGDIEVEDFEVFRANLPESGALEEKLVVLLTNDESIQQNVEVVLRIVKTNPTLVSPNYVDTLAITQFLDERSVVLFEISDDLDDGIVELEYLGMDPQVIVKAIPIEEIGLTLTDSGIKPLKYSLELNMKNFSIFSDAFYKSNPTLSGDILSTTLVFRAKDGKGLEEILNIRLAFRRDFAATISMEVPKSISDYKANDLIARLRDAKDGGIKEIPKSVKLNGLAWVAKPGIMSPFFELQVADPNKFKDWVLNGYDFVFNGSTETYSFSTTIEVWDEFKGQTFLPLDLVVLKEIAAAGPPVVEPTVSWIPGKQRDLSSIVAGEKLAMIQASDNVTLNGAMRINGDSLQQLGLDILFSGDSGNIMVTNADLFLNAIYGPQATIDTGKNMVSLPIDLVVSLNGFAAKTISGNIDLGLQIEKGVLYYYQNNLDVKALPANTILAQFFSGDPKIKISDVNVTAFNYQGLKVEMLGNTGGGIIRVDNSIPPKGGIYDFEIDFLNGATIVASQKIHIRIYSNAMEMHVLCKTGDFNPIIIDLETFFPSITNVSTSSSSYVDFPKTVGDRSRSYNVFTIVPNPKTFYLNEAIGSISASLDMPELGKSSADFRIYFHRI